MEIRKQFENTVKEYFESKDYAKISDLFLNPKSKLYDLKNRKTKYNMLYWYPLELKEPVEFEGELVEKLYIMPYRIKKNDVDKAVSKKADGFPDVDCRSGNFHKLPDMELQILFIRAKLPSEKSPAGPGKMYKISKGDSIDEKHGIVKVGLRKYKYKKNWRFPAIGSENENKKYSLEELMKETIKLLYPGD